MDIGKRVQGLSNQKTECFSVLHELGNPEGRAYAGRASYDDLGYCSVKYERLSHQHEYAMY